MLGFVLIWLPQMLIEEQFPVQLSVVHTSPKIIPVLLWLSQSEWFAFGSFLAEKRFETESQLLQRQIFKPPRKLRRTFIYSRGNPDKACCRKTVSSLMHLLSWNAYFGCLGIKLSPRLLCGSFCGILSKAVNNHWAVSTLSSVSETVPACTCLRTLGLAASLPGTLCTQFGSLLPSPLGAGLLENFPSATVRWAEPLLVSLHPTHRRIMELHHICHSQRTTGLFVSLFHPLNFCIKMCGVLITAAFAPRSFRDKHGARLITGTMLDEWTTRRWGPRLILLMPNASLEQAIAHGSSAIIAFMGFS